jgi:glutathione S-transferase
MFPGAEPERHRALKVATMGVHTAEKAVSLFYEKALHKETSDLWVNRCRLQISGTLGTLEKDRAARKTPYWFGDRIGHADIAVAAALRFIYDAHASVISVADFPALAAHSRQHEAMTVFQAISQAFIPPA